jgi:hypothetical protein
MVFKHDEILEKFKKCKYRVYMYCKANDCLIETPVERIGYCGNCIANQSDPNVF